MSTFEDLSSIEIVDMLREKIDSNSLKNIIDNELDGESILLMLEDEGEFAKVIPKIGSRLKLKKLVKSLSTTVTVPGSNDSEIRNLEESFEDKNIHDWDNATCTSVDDDMSIDKEPVLPDDLVGSPPLSKKAKIDMASTTKTVTDTVERFDIDDIKLPPLSVYSKAVQDVISANDKLGSSESVRLSFIRETVKYFQCVLPRPTSAEYTAISKAICDKHPSLKNKGSMYWKTFNSQFTQRYRNTRRPQRSTKSSSTCVVLPQVIRQPVRVEDQSGSACSSNLQEEYEENVKALKLLFTTGKIPAPSTVKTLLNVTRSQRSTWLKQLMSVHDIVESYPCLKISKWLLYEFGEVTEEPEMATKMTKRWNTVCEVMGNWDGVGSVNGAAEITTIQMVVKNIYHKSPKEEAIVIKEVGTDLEKVFDCVIAEPRLVVFWSEKDGRIEEMCLAVENESLFTINGNTLSEGLVHLMAAYYVYNVDYPKPCKATFYFLQDILMGKRDTSHQRPVRYSTFIDKTGLQELN